VAHTHDLTFAGDVLTKRYTSWSRGEHQREWTVLGLTHHHLPDLVPEPLSADLNANPPTIIMSRLPGVPLPGDPALAQLEALAKAIQALWTVPLVGEWQDDLPFARRLTAGARPAGGIAAEAYDAAQAWWDGPDPELLRIPPADLVLGHRDPNLANYLWDGTQIRIVDFEDSAPSDPATELAILAEHLSARHLNFDLLITRFPVIDERRFHAARRAFAMLWLRLLLNRQPGRRPPDPPGIVDMQAARLLRLLA
jgi:hypothetical protein